MLNDACVFLPRRRFQDLRPELRDWAWFLEKVRCGGAGFLTQSACGRLRQEEHHTGKPSWLARLVVAVRGLSVGRCTEFFLRVKESQSLKQNSQSV